MSNFISFTTVTFTIVNRERGEPDQTISHESCNKSPLSAIISGSTTSSQQAFPSSEKIEQSCNRDETCATPRIKLFFIVGDLKAPRGTPVRDKRSWRCQQGSRVLSKIRWPSNRNVNMSGMPRGITPPGKATRKQMEETLRPELFLVILLLATRTVTW